MDAQPSFEDWMARIRGGDAGAAAELVRHYEKAIRVAVRVRLTDPRLRRHFDSLDVCQSVLGSFFVRAAAGQYDLANPGQLVGLLVKMAQNKLVAQVRRHRASRRDVGRVDAPGDEDRPAPDPAPGPDRHAIGRDLLERLLERLDGAARELAQRRAVGQGWNDIARDLGGSPNAHRMRLARAIDQVARDLGLDDAGPDEDGP